MLASQPVQKSTCASKNTGAGSGYLFRGPVVSRALATPS